MGFRKLPGNKGMIYVPEQSKEKKNPCPDCFSCQWCSDDRCRLCRTGKCRPEPGKKRSKD